MVSELVSQRAFATEAGTARFAKRQGQGRDPSAYNHLGQLHLSSLGLGSYLGPATDAQDQAYEDAVLEAVRRGVNVIDTASNYRCQRSERAIGKALATLLHESPQSLLDPPTRGELYRSELLIASKAGFVAFEGQPPCDPGAWFSAQTIGQGLCAEDELVANCHCMAPAFLTVTLQKSRANLGLATLDVYFVHNPETQLQILGRDVVEARLRRAFEALEAAADRGEIRVYGIATWSGLRARPGERDYLSLERVVRLAEDVAGLRHRCKAVQLPVSLAMPEACVLANQTVRGETMTALQAAQKLGLVAFASAPLHQGRLARVRPGHVAPLQDLDSTGLALQFARSLPGVASALVGMANPAHVRENTRLFDLPRAPSAWLERAAHPPTAAVYP